MFILKKIISPFLMPYTLIILLCLAGLVLLWSGRRQKLGRALLTLAVALLLAVSSSFIIQPLVADLERQYPPYLPAQTQPLPPAADEPAIAYVVVLGGGHTPDPALPVSARINQAALARLTEGVRQYRLHPGSKLVVSGGAVATAIPETETRAELALIFGVPAEDIIREYMSRDTGEQAAAIRQLLQEAPFILVTSANHMPRAMQLFARQGLNPQAAPSDFRIRQDPQSDWLGKYQQFFPASRNIGAANQLMHEHLGIWWGKISAQQETVMPVPARAVR